MRTKCQILFLHMEPRDQEKIKGKRFNPPHWPYSKIIPLESFLDHSWWRKSQEDLEIANHVTRISFTWTAQAALHAFSSSTKTSTQRVVRLCKFFILWDQLNCPWYKGGLTYCGRVWKKRFECKNMTTHSALNCRKGNVKLDHKCQ